MRLRKTAPIDREYSVYEVLDSEGDVLFDVGKSDEGVYEVSLFDGRGRGRVLPLEDVLSLVGEARRLIDDDA
jgi:hypothetical protein